MTCLKDNHCRADQVKISISHLCTLHNPSRVPQISPKYNFIPIYSPPKKGEKKNPNC